MSKQMIPEELKSVPATQYDLLTNISNVQDSMEEMKNSFREAIMEMQKESAAMRSDMRELINELKSTNDKRNVRCDWHNDTTKNMQLEIDSLKTKVTDLQKYVNIGLGIVGALQFAIIVFISIIKMAH